MHTTLRVDAHGGKTTKRPPWVVANRPHPCWGLVHTLYRFTPRHSMAFNPLSGARPSRHVPSPHYPLSGYSVLKWRGWCSEGGVRPRTLRHFTCIQDDSQKRPNDHTEWYRAS